MRRIGYISGLLAALASFALAQVLPDNAQQEAWQHFNQQHGGKVFIRWHAETGTPATIYGFKSKPYAGLNRPDEIARQFLKDNRAIFRMDGDLSDLVLLRAFEDNDVYHIDFKQTYDGIPVYGAEYSVAVGADKTIHMAGGRYYTNTTAPANAVISEEEARERALAFFNMEKSDLRESESELVIVPGDAPFLAYRLGLNQWEAVVNAGTGKVEIYFERYMRIGGTGNVYPKDPVNSSLTTVTIPRLLGAGYYLDGTYIEATNDNLGDAFSASRNFQYTPPSYTQHDSTHFDDANVYYHVDKYYVDYWQAVGFSGLGVQVLASVHDSYPYGHDNAVANWGTMRLYFGHGISIFWDLAKQNDVIYHEYTHLVSGYIGLGGGGYQSAMHEGYSDYHAASFTSDPQIGEWVTRCTDTGDLREILNSKTYFNDDNYNDVEYAWCAADSRYLNSKYSAHANGMIWSGALWDLRAALGSSITDFLVYKGLVYKHASGTTFLDGAEGIVIADQNYYNGTHVSSINSVFYYRGLDLAPSAPTNLQQTAGWGENVHLIWEKSPEPDVTRYYVYRKEEGHSYGSIGWTSDTSFTDRDVIVGPPMATWYYHVKARDAAFQYSPPSNEVNIVGMIKSIPPTSKDAPLPKTYSLIQNYPNPFNPSTTIRYELPQDSRITLAIYDIMGREVRTLIQGEQAAGNKSVVWEGTNNIGQPVSSGVYLYRLQAGEFSLTKKMVLLR